MIWFGLILWHINLCKLFNANWGCSPFVKELPVSTRVMQNSSDELLSIVDFTPSGYPTTQLSVN